MSKQGISTGSAPNDGTGDTLLAGTIKINNNFNEIYDILQQVMQMLVRLQFNSLVRLQMVLLRLELQQQCSESKQTVWSALEHHYPLHN